MHKRVVAIFAMVTLVLGLGFGSALAHHNEGHEQGPPENTPAGCERSGNPDACEPGEEEPEESPCAQAPAPLDQVCQIIVDLLAGETPEPPGGGGEPSCDDLAAVDPALADGCQQVVDQLPL